MCGTQFMQAKLGLLDAHGSRVGSHSQTVHIMQRIFSSATRRETLGKHLKGDRRGGELKIDWTKPPPRA